MRIEWNGVKYQASKQQHQSRPKERRAPGEGTGDGADVDGCGHIQ